MRRLRLKYCYHLDLAPDPGPPLAAGPALARGRARGLGHKPTSMPMILRAAAPIQVLASGLVPIVPAVAVIDHCADLTKLNL